MTVKTFAQVDAEGNVVCICTCEDHDRDTFTDPAGNVTFMLPPEGIDQFQLLTTYKVVDGKWKFIGEQPTRWHVWNKLTGWEFNFTAAWQEVKRERNLRISATDWTQLPDVPENTRIRYTVYRQALRDITKQSDPTAIVWPELPDQ